MKRITVVTPCHNKEENIREPYGEIKRVLADLPQYE